MSAIPRRENLRRLVDRLPEDDLETAERVLGALVAWKRDPVLAAFRNAPLDDEEVTEEDLAAWAESDRAIAEGDVFTDEEVRRRLGL